MKAKTETPTAPSFETDSQRLGWWPATHNGGIVQGVLLVAAFWAAKGGFLYHLYSTLISFFLLTAIRYGWIWLNRGARSAHSIPRWQNPGLIAVAFCALHYAVILPIVKPGAPSTAEIREKVDTALNATKQKWFDRFHPIGTAKSIKLHEVKVDETPQGKRTTARFTLYWEGPITKDGFTKILAIHDAESNRWVSAEILETNGTTKAQAAEGAAAFIDGFLQGQ